MYRLLGSLIYRTILMTSPIRDIRVDRIRSMGSIGVPLGRGQVKDDEAKRGVATLYLSAP
jgi:hypothetical protein